MAGVHNKALDTLLYSRQVTVVDSLLCLYIFGNTIEAFGTVTPIKPLSVLPPCFPELHPANAFIRTNSLTLLMPVMQPQLDL